MKSGKFQEHASCEFDDRIAIFRQHARQIVDQTAAGDMSETMNCPARNFRQQRLIIFVHAQ